MHWDAKQLERELAETATPILTRAMAEGATAEALLRRMAGILRQKRLEAAGTKTTAGDWARDNLTPDDLPGVPTEAPQWFRDAAYEQLRQTFDQPYWQRINQTTRDDIQRTLETAVGNGWSTARTAKEITTNHGAAYSLHRGRTVARTEVANMMNAGHVAAIRRTEEETGLKHGKEWASVLANTTRDTHAAADGQVVTLDEDFIVGGESAPWPGHWSLSAGERVSCLCTTVSALTMAELPPESQPDAEPPKVEPEAGPGAQPPLPGEDPETTETDPWHPDAVAKMAVRDVLAEHPELLELQQKAEKALAAAEKRVNKQLPVELEAKREAEARISEIRNKIDDLLARGLKYEQTKPLLEALRAERNAAELILEQADAKLEKLMREPTTAIHKALALKPGQRAPLDVAYDTKGHNQTTDDGIRESTGKFSQTYKAKAKEARDFLRTILHRDYHGSADLLRVTMHSLGGRGRAFARNEYNTRTGLPMIQRIAYRRAIDGVYLHESDTPGTFVHEMTHHLDHMNPAMLKRSLEYQAARLAASGKPSVKLKDVVPGANYQDHEIGNDDDFAKIWANRQGFDEKRKTAFAHYTGKSYGDAATEMTTMAVQALFEDPVGLLRSDPETFKFAVGLLRGTLR